MTLACLSSDYAAMGELFRNFLFFGVPHRGNDGVRYSETLSNLIRAVGGPVDEALISALEDDKPKILRVHQDFLDCANNIRVFSIQEGKESKVLKKGKWKKEWILDDEASCMGLGHEMENEVIQQLDHNMLCKFESEHDPAYLTMVVCLKSLAQR